MNQLKSTLVQLERDVLLARVAGVDAEDYALEMRKDSSFYSVSSSGTNA